jgi:hypothetical protein
MLDRDHVAATALERAVNDLRLSLPEGFVPELELADAHVQALGLDPTRVFLRSYAEVNEARIEVARVIAAGLIAWMMDRQRAADRLDASGDADGASDVRRLAVLAARDLLDGRLSDELLDREYDGGDGFQPEDKDVEDYDALCARHGTVELVDAAGAWVREDRAPKAATRPVRRTRSILRSRPRARRHRSRGRIVSSASGEDRPGRSFPPRRKFSRDGEVRS